MKIMKNLNLYISENTKLHVKELFYSFLKYEKCLIFMPTSIDLSSSFLNIIKLINYSNSIKDFNCFLFNCLPK